MLRSPLCNQLISPAVITLALSIVLLVSFSPHLKNQAAGLSGPSHSRAHCLILFGLVLLSSEVVIQQFYVLIRVTGFSLVI